MGRIRAVYPCHDFIHRVHCLGEECVQYGSRGVKLQGAGRRRLAVVDVDFLGEHLVIDDQINADVGVIPLLICCCKIEVRCGSDIELVGSPVDRQSLLAIGHCTGILR